MENQTNTGKTLRVFNCQGLSIETGDHLRKIQDSVLETPFYVDIAYILNDDGNIICTIVNSKTEYESAHNTDRRHNNLKNGFEVFWDAPGLECTIYYRKKNTSKPGSDFMANLKKPIVWIGAAVVIAVFVLCLIFTTKEDDTSLEPITEPSTAIEPSVQTEDTWQQDSAISDVEPESLPQQEPIATVEPKVETSVPDPKAALQSTLLEADKLFEKWKVMLWKDDCSRSTVMNIRNELDGIKDADLKKQAKDKIEPYLKDYEAFFNTKTKEDLEAKNLSRNHFSIRQKSVIWNHYFKSAQEYEFMRQVFGNHQFSEPIMTGFGDN